ncbi:hypothetical protein ABN763_09010 [Spongiivirga sp. MCCC 1A20706]|uniref:hypothetical protein n=1 Tax=Spongiivirga sp. MCCC 1A20706 TaxID=3160963 RepID=UPI003977314B
MKNSFFYFTLLSLFLVVSCKQNATESTSNLESNSGSVVLAKVIEENYDIKSDSTVFKSANIENFDQDGKSIDVFWLGQEKDTVLRFYRKYDKNNKLVGAEYYEQGDIEPSRDTVFLNSNGLKVEAALNAENQISWKSTITTDAKGNPILKTYENGKGEYRGLDSLFFDDQNRIIKGFYENSKGKRYGIKTYQYLKSDEKGNWTERNMFVNDTLRQKQTRILTYHE